jgi:arylsulfatase A-like enzyme
MNFLAMRTGASKQILYGSTGPVSPENIIYAPMLPTHVCCLSDRRWWRDGQELGVHIPLIIRAPHLLASIGETSFALVEMVDVYPTVAALSGLPAPESQGQQLNGTSLLPIFQAPRTARVKTAAYSQFAKGGGVIAEQNNWGPNLPVNFSIFNKFHRNQTELMGYSIRVEEWRYTACVIRAPTSSDARRVNV